MKTLSLIFWVTQFGLSVLLPPCFFLWLAAYLQQTHGFGMWTSIVGIILGLLTSFSTAKANWRTMRRDAQKDSPPSPVSFNDHL